MARVFENYGIDFEFKGKSCYINIVKFVSGKSDEKFGDRVKGGRALSKRCADDASAKTCQRAAKNNLCTKGRLGGFGSTIRARCAATCNIC